MTIANVALAIHVAAGTVSLAVFWLPLVTKKGGRLHRRAGWVYVVATAVLAASAWVVSGARLLDADPRNDPTAIFLVYIGLLTATSAHLGVRALQTKRRTGPHRGVVDLLLPALLAAGGLAVGAYGASRGAALYLVFAALGVALGSIELRFWLRAPATRIEYLMQHIGGMGGSCIATVTAFLVVNANRFGLGTFNLVVWVAPGVLGGVGIALWQRAYRKRFATRGTNARSVTSQPSSPLSLEH
jgi:uncharacterized membrane protein